MKKAESYLQFHFLKGPQEIIRIAGNFLIFLWHFFSVGLLLRTFFAPWKRLYLQKTTSGFQPEEWFRRLTFNAISRMMGMIIRVLTIICGFWACLAALLLTGCLAVLWLILPIVSLPAYLVWSLKKGDRGEKVKREKLKQFFALRFANIPLATVSVKDKSAVTAWFERVEQEVIKSGSFWERENLLSVPALGRDWAAGYTLALDQYTLDLAAPKYYSSHLVGRREEAEKIERILSGTTRRGCLLVGEPGVGKQTIVENFAKRVKEKKTRLNLSQKRVLMLHVSSLLGEAKNKDSAKERILEILKEAGRAENVILVIDNFDQFVTTQDERIDLTPALTRAMSETNLPIIGLTSPANFQKFIFSNQKILEYFEKIEVSVPGKVEAMEILEDIAPYFERKTGVVATFPALKEIVNQSDRWVTEIPFPEKAIELLDDCLVYAQGLPVRHPELVSGSRFLQPEHVRQVLAEKTKIPLQELSAGEKEVIAGMEEILHKRVIGQDHAIADIAKALRRRKAGVGAGKRPIGAFLFLGPTGVGKTETAKALAEALFGSEKKMIRLDMAQFQARGAIDRLIGSFARNEPGILTSAVRQNPYSVLLLDEIEKASREVQNLFLTAIDEGYLTDTFGHVVNLENLLIIGTSNAGAEFIRQKIVSSRHPELGSGSIEVEIPKRVRNDSRAVNYQKLSDQLTDFVLREGLFSPEFINRFDALVVYDPLDHNELVQIARLQLELLNKRLAEKKISVEITDDLLDKIARLGYDPTFGARPMKRVIADKVEDVIAKKILAGEIKKGEKIRIEI